MIIAFKDVNFFTTSFYFIIDKLFEKEIFKNSTTKKMLRQMLLLYSFLYSKKKFDETFQSLFLSRNIVSLELSRWCNSQKEEFLDFDDEIIKEPRNFDSRRHWGCVKRSDARCWLFISIQPPWHNLHAGLDIR